MGRTCKRHGSIRRYDKYPRFAHTTSFLTFLPYFSPFSSIPYTTVLMFPPFFIPAPQTPSRQTKSIQSNSLFVKAWTGLCDAGLGANLQHYQKYMGATMNEFAGVPKTWTGTAQLVFGTPNGPPRGGVDKPFADIEPRVKVLGA